MLVWPVATSQSHGLLHGQPTTTIPCRCPTTLPGPTHHHWDIDPNDIVFLNLLIDNIASSSWNLFFIYFTVPTLLFISVGATRPHFPFPRIHHTVHWPSSKRWHYAIIPYHHTHHIARLFFLTEKRMLSKPHILLLKG